MTASILPGGRPSAEFQLRFFAQLALLDSTQHRVLKNTCCLQESITDGSNKAGCGDRNNPCPHNPTCDSPLHGCDAPCRADSNDCPGDGMGRTDRNPAQRCANNAD